MTKQRVQIALSEADARAAWEKILESGRVFGVGEIRLAVMSLLANGPRHGYGVMQDLESRLALQYKASAGSVYPALKQLEAEGLVACERQASRKVYSLTRSGRRELAKNPEVFEQIWRRFDESHEEETAKDNLGDITTSLHRLLKAAYRAGECTVGRPGGEAALRGILNHAADQLERFTRRNEQKEGA